MRNVNVLATLDYVTVILSERTSLKKSALSVHLRKFLYCFLLKQKQFMKQFSYWSPGQTY